MYLDDVSKTLLNVDILLNECQRDISLLDLEYDSFFIKEMNDNMLFTEASKKEEEKIESIWKKVVGIFTEIKNKIIDLFTSKKTNKSIEVLNEKIKENPELAKKEVKILDYEALDKLNRETQKELRKSNIDPYYLMDRYRNQRNKILKTGAIVTTTLGACLFAITKNKNKKIQTLDDTLKSTEKEFIKYQIQHRAYKEKINNRTRKLNRELENRDKAINGLKGELQIWRGISSDKRKAQVNKIKKSKDKKQAIADFNTRFAAHTNKVVNDTKDNTKKLKGVISSTTEIVCNSAKDTLNQVTDTIKVVSNGEKSSISKVKSVIDNTKNIKSTVTNLMNGNAHYERDKEKKEEIRYNATQINDKIKKWEKIIKSEGVSKSDKEKAIKNIALGKQKLQELSDEFKIIKERIQKRKES